MTSVIINDILPLTQIVATGGQTVFSTDWTANYATDVVVYSRAAAALANDVTQIISPSLYSVAFIGGSQIVQVTLVNPSTLGDIVTITRQTPADRANLYTNTNFTPSMLNNDFGVLTLVDQQNQLVNQQIAPRYNYSALIEPVVDTILPILEALQSWRKNSSNTGFEAVEVLDGDELSSNDLPYGATMVGLHPSGTVQDFANSKFIVQQGNATIPNAQALADLQTGILRNQTATGLVDISIPLTSIDELTTAADEMIYTTAQNVYATTPLTAVARTVLDDATTAEMRVTLGVEIGVDVQAYNPNLQQLSALGTAADRIAYTTGVQTWAETPLTAYARTLLDDANAAAARATLEVSASADSFLIANNLSEGDGPTKRTNLGLAIGTNVQAFDQTLQSLSALGTTADIIAFTTGVDSWSETTISPYGRQIIALANAADAGALLDFLPLSGGTMTGPLYLASDPTLGSQAATKAYVDNKLANQEQAAVASTVADMPTWIYDNGVAGLGATLTAPVNGATANSVFDDVAVVDGNRIFLNFQTSNEAWQGLYTIVQGTAGTPTVLTRATDWDQAPEMQAGDFFSVVQGTLYGASQWMFAQVDPITVGTTALLFSQIFGNGALLRANNLSDLSNAALARDNMGVEIGVDVQAFDATLQSISGLGTAADKMIYTTGIDTWAESDILVFGRSLLGLASSAGGIPYSTGTVAGLLAGTAAAGQMLQSGAAAAPSWSTAVYPSVAGASGNVLTSDGTNIISSPPVLQSPLTTKGDIFAYSTTNDRFPVATGDGKILQVNAAATFGLDYSTATYPSIATSTGSMIYADGTNFVQSTSLWPNTVGSAGKLIRSDGTVNAYTTATYPDTAGTVGNVLTSDGTNFVSSPNTGGASMSSVLLLMGG